MIGHEPIRQFFEAAREHQSLAQVYCFVGPDRVGKRTLAKIIAGQLLNTDPSRLDHHPDYTYVERLEDEKTGKLKKDVSIGQARELRGKLERRSWLGGYHVVIINEAETLNAQSSNALLKALEEPALKTIIFLLTDNESDLLLTIRSRSQLIYFSLVPDQVLVKGLCALGFAEPLADEVAPLSFGRPGLAVALCQDEELRTGVYAELQRFTALLNRPFYHKSKVLEELFKEKEDGERQRDRLQTMLNIWLVAWRTLLLRRSGVELPSNSFTRALVGVEVPLDRIMANIHQVIEAKAELRYNVNQRLLIEQCILAF